MEEQNNQHGTLFESRLVFFLTHVLAPFAAIGAFAHASWLGWTECAAEVRWQILLSLGFLLLLPIAASLRLLLVRRPIGLVAQCLFMIAGLLLFFPVKSAYATVMRSIEIWAVSPLESFNFIFSATILIGTGLGRIATAKWPVPKDKDLGVTLLLAFGIPLLCIVPLWLGTFTFACAFHDSLGFLSYFIPVLVVIGGVSMFIGLFRLIFMLFAVITKKGKTSRTAELTLTLVCALVLPLLGLALNLNIPFPADFANPWAWGLTIWTTFVFLPRAGESGRFGLFTWFLQWTAMPFVLYFFLLFLPFLPLAILLVFAAAAGFLVLAPTILFRWTTAKLSLKWGSLRGRGVSKRVLVLAALAGALVLPIGFVVDVEIERVGLQTLLRWHTQEDFMKDEMPLPVSETRARRIVENANDFAVGSEIPFLSGYRTLRVYNGMYLDDQLREELNVRVFGKPSGREVDDWQVGRNLFGSVFGWNTGRRNGRERTWTTRPRQTKACSVTLGEIEGNEFEVTIQAQNEYAGEAEFVAELGIPAGAWVRALELEMADGKWKAARLSERKAAEWVYRKITDQRLDPSILTTDGPGRGILKVFPVAQAGRGVRFRLVLPEGEAGDRYININGTRYGEAASAERIWSEGELSIVSAGWAAAHTNELKWVGTARETLYFNGQDPDLYRQLRRAAHRKAATLAEDLGSGKGPVEFVITNQLVSIKNTLKWRERTKSKFVNLNAKKKALLRKIYPGQVAFGDDPVDGWYLMGSVPVPYRMGEGALVTQKIEGADEVSTSNEVWHDGANVWALERKAFLNPQDDLRKEILNAARKKGIVSDAVAAIVLETMMQKKGLQEAEETSLQGAKSLEFEEPADEESATNADAPEFVLLLIAFALVFGGVKLKRRVVMKFRGPQKFVRLSDKF